MNSFTRFDAVLWATRHSRAQAEWQENELNWLKIQPPCFVCYYTSQTYWAEGGVRLCEDCAYSQDQKVAEKIQELKNLHAERIEQLKK